MFMKRAIPLAIYILFTLHAVYLSSVEVTIDDEDKKSLNEQKKPTMVVENMQKCDGFCKFLKIFFTKFKIENNQTKSISSEEAEKPFSRLKKIERSMFLITIAAIKY